jgi:bifunctional DNA-binding transcriptional regulator/antitoxin component of YhaV-PrlF toxin-antitoxin module
MRNEWNLLVDSDGIEIGDDLIVEDDDGETICKLKKYNSKFVWLKNEDGTVDRFSAETLESVSGYKVIKGKA